MESENTEINDEKKNPTRIPIRDLFNTGDEYLIPIYQRPFAWGQEQIEQLIDDILSIGQEESYYLGSLIVDRKKESPHKYEVIDGQQRLTAIFLLFKVLESNSDERFFFQGNPAPLCYECRDNSNITLERISTFIRHRGGGSEDPHLFFDAQDKDIDESLLRGLKDIEIKLSSLDTDDKSQLISNLSKVAIFRIQVPGRTDLNRYFEIMNTRGEQLEPVDILKAQLIEPLTNESAKSFAAIWDACRDMDGYVQMHFSTSLRERFFGKYWTGFDEENVRRYVSGEDEGSKELSDGKDEESQTFTSIVDFPHFILHVLNVMNESKNDTKNQLDERVLLDTFDEHRENSVFSEEFSKRFIVQLLKTRYLFDKYVIKRKIEGRNDNNGEWSLQELHSSLSGNSRSPQYVNTIFKYRKREWKKTSDERYKRVLMLQSCLRVSVTAQRSMYWLTDLLKWLNHLNDGQPEHNLDEYEAYIESIIQKDVKVFLYGGNYSMGTNTPHIVLNYLDYLLWKENDSYKDFFFDFNRNSVEHWYPQHPTQGTFTSTGWEYCDMFGNLCLVSREINSKFSNASPRGKKVDFKEYIQGGSLKLREMSKLTEGADADDRWCESICLEHQNLMLDKLRAACGIDKSVKDTD